MNIRKIAEKTMDFLSSDERKRKEKKAFLKHVIKKLKKHEKALVAKLEDEKDAVERAKIESEIALTHAQRKKGLLKLSELKKSKKKG
ncbi:hypothetical protein [Haloferula sp.]|uniref:hypothetical protein n=1 Tax=Haloferula sp. TaxID=2497595 RepID=UPI003C757854